MRGEKIVVALEVWFENVPVIGSFELAQLAAEAQELARHFQLRLSHPQVPDASPRVRVRSVGLEG